MRVLLVEDDDALAETLVRGLGREGFIADRLDRGEDAVWKAKAVAYDAIVLDVMLPGMDGMAACARLRDEGVQTPVLMLTARDAVSDRVDGLEAGADDYLPKPFAWDELVARLRALARRSAVLRHPVIEVGPLALDTNRREVRCRGERVDLSGREFALLELLMRRAGDALSRVELLDGAWDGAYENRSNVVDVHIAALRRKLDRPGDESLIETVRGVGYRLTDEG